MYRHRIEQFVGQHQPVEMLGQPIQPHNPAEQMRRSLFDGLALPFAQLAGKIKNGVALGQRPALFQFEQQIRGQAPRTRPDLDNLRRAERHDLHRLRGKGLAKERGNFRRRNKVTRRTKLMRPARVIPHPRRVKSELHKPVKAEPTARSGDFAGNASF